MRREGGCLLRLLRVVPHDVARRARLDVNDLPLQLAQRAQGLICAATPAAPKRSGRGPRHDDDASNHNDTNCTTSADAPKKTLIGSLALGVHMTYQNICYSIVYI